MSLPHSTTPLLYSPSSAPPSIDIRFICTPTPQDKHVLLASTCNSCSPSFFKKSHIQSLNIFSFLTLFSPFLHMDVSKPKYEKTLKEHLQQQQEPFSLQNYVIERSYMFKNCNSDSSNIHSLYSAKNLKWSIKYDLHKIRKRFIHATGALRSVLYKFIPTVDNQEFLVWDGERISDQYYVHEVIAYTQETQQTDELFSMEKLAASDYFTGNDVEGMFQTFTLPNLRRSEVDSGYTPCWIGSKEIKQQHSRGSEWKEPLPNAVCLLRGPEAPATSLLTLSQKFVRDLVLSNYLRKLLTNSNILKLRRSKKDKLQDMVGTTPCRRNRRVLQKREQLPFECLEKGREFYLKEGKSLSIKADSGSEDLRSVMHEHFSFLEKQCRGVKKITHILYAESSVTSEEWKNFQIVNSVEIQMEIGDAIFDDIVREIIDLF